MKTIIGYSVFWETEHEGLGTDQHTQLLLEQNGVYIYCRIFSQYEVFGPLQAAATLGVTASAGMNAPGITQFRVDAITI